MCVGVRCVCGAGMRCKRVCDRRRRVCVSVVRATYVLLLCGVKMCVRGCVTAWRKAVCHRGVFRLRVREGTLWK